MAKQTINIGASPNDGTGTPLRTSFDYCNLNFTELYTAVGPSGNNIVCPGSATISGDLTVDTSTLKVDSTNNRVGIGTATPANACQIQGAGQATVTPTVTGDQSALSLIDSGFAANNGGMLTFGSNVSNGYIGQAAIKSLLVNGTQNGTSDLAFFTRGAASDSTLAERYRIAVNGVATWSNVGGTSGAAMTLNSTGLGVGVNPLGKLHIRQSGAGIQDVGYFENNQAAAADVGARVSLLGTGSVAMATVESAWNGAASTDAYLSFRTRGSGSVVERLRIDSSGNVGIGVTPSAWGGSNRAALQFPGGNAIQGSAAIGLASFNNCFNNGTNDICIANGTTYKHVVGTGYQWFIGTGTAGNSFSFGDAKMTLDASGNLILSSSSTPATLATNGQLTVNATSNTNLRFSYRGSDGVTRTANLTLA